MKTSVIGFIMFLFLAATGTAQETDTVKYKVLPPEEFIKEFNDNADAALIDVRNIKDYKKSRISGAVNLPFPDISDDYFGGPDAIPVDKSLFIYCYAGFWSRKAAVMFYDHGYRNIFSLEGGFNRWKSRKMPVEKKKIKTTD